MDDRYHIEVILKSPSSFLRGLGLQELYLYRPHGPYSGTIELSLLDDNIRNRGPACLLRGFASDGDGVFVHLKKSASEDTYQCLLLEFDYTGGEFYFGLRRNVLDKIIFLGMEEMWQSGFVLKPTDESFFLPPA